MEPTNAVTGMTAKPCSNNHFVPQFYLRKWANGNNALISYNLEKNKRNRSEGWYRSAVKSTAVVKNLYSGQVEQWLSQEFETPCAGVFLKLMEQDGKGSIHLWKKEIDLLENFAAIQYLRLPKLVNKLSAHILFSSQKVPINPASEVFPQSFYCRMRINQNLIQNTAGRYSKEKIGLMEASKMISPLVSSCEWTIIKAAKGVFWGSSDSPVICLRGISKKGYQFDGSWNQVGTEIFFPLTPSLLLYTKVGKKGPQTYNADRTASQKIQDMIIAHADSQVYLPAENSELFSSVYSFLEEKRISRKQKIHAEVREESSRKEKKEGLSRMFEKNQFVFC